MVMDMPSTLSTKRMKRERILTNKVAPPNRRSPSAPGGLRLLLLSMRLFICTRVRERKLHENLEAPLLERTTPWNAVAADASETGDLN